MWNLLLRTRTLKSCTTTWLARKFTSAKNITKGLGGGMNPEMGKKAAEETKETIQESIKGADMVLFPEGKEGTATGALPVVARIAKEQGILTIAVVTKPFGFEGAHRSRLAEQGLINLKEAVDAMIVIPNDRLLSIVGKETTFLSAFQICDDVLRQAVEGISDLITMPGIINVDFADVKTIMQNAGSALMGIGYGQGEKRAGRRVPKWPSIPRCLIFPLKGPRVSCSPSPADRTWQWWRFKAHHHHHRINRPGRQSDIRHNQRRKAEKGRD